MDIPLDFDGICKRMMEVTSQRSLTGVALFLGMAKSAPDRWKKLEKIPGDVVINAALKTNGSIDYILFGSARIYDEKVFKESFGNALTSLVASECIDIKDDYNGEKVLEAMRQMINEIEKNRNNSSIDILGGISIPRK